jgi:3-mercaptopyruvate sulfurtransferase SseA
LLLEGVFVRSKFYFALIVLVAAVLAACNAVDNTANTKPAQLPGADTVYADGARRVTAEELDTMMKNGQAIVVDVRTQAAYDVGHIPGSKLIPAGEILNHLDELPRDKMIVTYCS